MAIWKFSAKSHSMFTSSDRVRLFALGASVLLSFAALCISVFAWYSVTRSSEGSVVINSSGIKIDASLSYIENVNFEGTPSELDYTGQAITSARIEQSGECYAGSVLYYKMSVSNISNQQANVEKIVPVDISLSMSDIGAYFSTLVDKFIVNPTDNEIHTIISKNNGTILYKLRSVKYVLASDQTHTVQTYTLPENTFISSAYAFGEPFFQYTKLGVDDTITVYFEFECMDPLTASTAYETFREAQIAAETNPIKAQAIKSAYEEELKSLVIKQEETGASMENAYLKIDYFSVYATPNFN